MPAEAAPTPPLVFARDLPCIHCSYNLRSLAISALCPECGKPARDSLDSLHAANPRDLARLRLGLLLMLLAASIIPVIAGAVPFTLSFLPFPYNTGSPMDHAMLGFGFAIGVLGPTMACVGTFFLATPVRRAVGITVRTPVSAPLARTTLLGAAALYPLCGSAVWLFALVVNTRWYSPVGRNEEPFIFALVSTIFLGLAAWSLRNFFACARLAALCRRAGARRTARLLAILKWISLAMLAGIMVTATALLTVYLFEKHIEETLDLVFSSGGRAGGSLQALLIVVGLLQMVVGFALVGWGILWPTSLAITLRHLGRVAAQATPNARGLLAVAPLEANAPPTVPPAAPAYRQNPHNPSPGATGAYR